uniref:Conotoxin reg3i n=1 Tax=Conus regius TaxID=101314 RepID=CM3I_CONRE|nr:RecName: Full=Conotoxin reg3i [Conus regius]
CCAIRLCNVYLCGSCCP